MRRPPWWALLLVTLAIAATAVLAHWQWRRGEDKQVLLDRIEAAKQGPLYTLRHAGSAAAVPVRARARGRYDSARQLLLDGQSRERQPGYHVWTPLHLDDGGIVLVNRGWVPASPDRRVLPDLALPAGAVTVQGLWRELPQPGLRLEGTVNCPEIKTFPAVVSYPRPGELRCLLEPTVAAGVLLLDADQPFGYVRDWPSAYVGLPPRRHYAYAAQWALLGLTLSILFIRAYRNP